MIKSSFYEKDTINFFILIFYSLLQGFDESLRPLLPFESIQEFSEISNEVTENFKGFTKNVQTSGLKAFEVTFDEGINHILVTDEFKKNRLGYLSYLFFEATLEKNVQKPAYIYITNLNIARQLRGQGMGTALFTYLCQKNHQEKISHIELTASASDYTHEHLSHIAAQERIMNFYKNLGMRKVPNLSYNKLILYLDETKKNREVI